MDPESSGRTEGVLEQLSARAEPADMEALSGLARAYLIRLPPTVAPDPEALAAEILSLFEFIRTRTETDRVRVFNPSIDAHGYTASGTVVEVHTGDSPFLLDSVTNEIRAHGLDVTSVIHPVIGVERDDDGVLRSIRHARRTTSRESIEHYVLDRTLFEGDHTGLEQAIRDVLYDVRRSVSDFHAMISRIDRMIELVRIATETYSEEEIGEAVAFLEWLKRDNFVLLGYREYRVFEGPDGRVVQAAPNTGLGILSETARSKLADPVLLSTLPPELSARYERGDLLVITKTNRMSPVHRRAKMDYVGVRIVGEDGSTVGEARLVGLFTSKAYLQPASQIPIIRRKLSSILAAEDLIEGSHDHKAMIQLVEGFSKDDLFVAPVDELRTALTGLLELEERHQVRLFVRRDLLEKSVHILVALPRDRFNPGLRRNLQDLFVERFEGRSADYHLALGESDPAQIHFTVWVDTPTIPEVSFVELEAEVVALTRSWTDKVRSVLGSKFDPPTAERLASTWAPRFPEYYRTSVEVEVAANDIVRLEELAGSDRSALVGIQNEHEAEQQQRVTRIALYRKEGKLPLNELMPPLVALGLEVVEEVPTRLLGSGDLFVHDFGVLGPGRLLIDMDETAEHLRQVVEAAWLGQADSDDLDRLVIVGGLGPCQIEVLRAYRRFWRRVMPVFTVAYVNDTLVAHAGTTAKLIRLFEARFDPALERADCAALRAEILADLDEIPSLEEDRILRSFLHLIEATLRTNAFVPGRQALSLKFRSKDVPDSPLPHPMSEIFVVSPRVEGIHLRGGPVARGGIRWSTRREDYRTEVLGLMKAQMTKNALIVPTGAKGGFVLRHPPEDPVELRAAIAREYEVFVGALLDVTDNMEGEEVVRPPSVRAHDGDDPYLVVAADKGTATFSDAANRIAIDRGFWLADAFASGGSSGYDHKALGITARGAWKCLERHFRELGIDPFVDDFTAVGIGDMSGDVFGNGMLESDRIKLVAAFDHRHVFLDPNPDPARSLAERRRLFELPSSSWDDYDRSLISEGGGVFPRTAKRVELSPEVRAVLRVEAEALTPNELIRAILCAPVDLLWNGGIGTYVKAATETSVGDRTNDPVRVNGGDLRCRVAVEGGNLGFTQAGRIEFCASGGRVNTDFIDNSGGVDCSDREVNLKILLGMAEREAGLTHDERNQVIADVVDDVVERILRDSFMQAQMISQELDASTRRMEGYEDLMSDLESAGILDRGVEGLPDTEEMIERARVGKGLARPELAVLLAYAKRDVKQTILESSLPDDPYLVDEIRGYFPGSVSSRFPDLVERHPLRRELIATQLANDIVNSEGVVFASRLTDQTGAGMGEVVGAYRVAKDVSDAIGRWETVESLFGTVDIQVFTRLMRLSDRTVASLTRWYLDRVQDTGIGELVRRYRPGFEEIDAVAPDVGPDRWRRQVVSSREKLLSQGVPESLAHGQSVIAVVPFAGDVVELAEAFGHDISETLDVFLRVGRPLGLDMLTELTRAVELRSRWQRIALWTVEEELVSVRRRGAERVLELAGGRSGEDAIKHFLDEREGHVARLSRFLDGLELGPSGDVAPLMVALRQVRAALA